MSFALLKKEINLSFKKYFINVYETILSITIICLGKSSIKHVIACVFVMIQYSRGHVSRNLKYNTVYILQHVNVIGDASW